MHTPRHTFEWWEEFWKSSIYSFGEPREELIGIARDFFQNHPSDRLTAIDIGSGNGRYALRMAEIGYITTALEMTSSGCIFIENKSRSLNLPIVTLQEDVLKIDPSYTYNLVLSSGLIEEIPQNLQSKAIENIKSLCAKDGLLILKYCLEISERGNTVEENFVPGFFSSDPNWNLIKKATDPKLRESIANIDFETKVRTETIIAKRVNASK